MAGVVTLQQSAGVGESSHDGLVVAQDLQAGEEQRLALTSRHHHLGRRRLSRINSCALIIVYMQIIVYFHFWKLFAIKNVIY